MRGRGLKHKMMYIKQADTESPPMRGRGLKHPICTFIAQPSMSPPMRGRGLKQYPYPQQSSLHQVAPHAGAWIETEKMLLFYLDSTVAPHAGAWIET